MISNNNLCDQNYLYIKIITIAYHISYIFEIFEIWLDLNIV